MKQPQKRAQILLAVALLLYACGYVTQFIGNYAVWQKNGGMLGGTSPPFLVAAGLSQRCSVVSLQSVLHGELRSSSRCNFPIPKAVQPGCPNGFRTQFRFLRKRHLRHVRLDAAARSPRRAGYGFRLIQAYRHCVGDARRKVSLYPGENTYERQPCRLWCQRLDENTLVLHESYPAKRRPRQSLIICDPKSELYENPASICGI